MPAICRNAKRSCPVLNATQFCVGSREAWGRSLAVADGDAAAVSFIPPVVIPRGVLLSDASSEKMPGRAGGLENQPRPLRQPSRVVLRRECRTGEGRTVVREAAFLGDCDEIAEMAQFHAVPHACEV
jgi:hypothetical protein